MTQAWTPNVVVAAIVQRDGHFLVVEEQDGGRRVLNQPAGHLERNESLLQAVCREVLEETCRSFSPEGLVGVYLYPRPGADHAYLRVCFHGSVGEPEPGRRLDPDILATRWVTRGELLGERDRLRSPMVLGCIDDYLAGRRFDLSLLRQCPPS